VRPCGGRYFGDTITIHGQGKYETNTAKNERATCHGKKKTAEFIDLTGGAIKKKKRKP